MVQHSGVFIFPKYFLISLSMGILQDELTLGIGLGGIAFMIGILIDQVIFLEKKLDL